jgi:hypothetical protein
MGASAFCWRAACQRRGGNPPGFPPEGETGKGEFRLPCCPQAVRAGPDGRHARWLSVCSLYHFSLHYYHQPNMSIRSIRFPEVLPAPPTPLPCFYPHSSWAAMGPVQVGVRSKAQVHHHHHGDGPRLLRAVSEGAILAGPPLAKGSLAFPCLPMVSERSSLSRVRFAATNTGAPLTAGRSEGTPSREEGKGSYQNGVGREPRRRQNGPLFRRH